MKSDPANEYEWEKQQQCVMDMAEMAQQSKLHRKTVRSIDCRDQHFCLAGNQRD